VRLTTTIGETGGKIHTQFPSAAARFYRSSLLAEANAADHRLRAARRDSGPLQSAMHPWPPTPGTAQPTDGGLTATDGVGGSGYAQSRRSVAEVLIRWPTIRVR